MHVDCVDSNNLYIATNSSSILHATCIGNKASPTVYKKFDTSKLSMTLTEVLSHTLLIYCV